MPKDILLYGQINEVSSAKFLTDMEAASEDEVTIRINTPGGSPEYTWGMIAKFSEHTGKKSVKVDGQALSMGTYFCCYDPAAEGLDVSQFLIHRAAYPEWYECEYMDEATKTNLVNVNASLQKALFAKIDVPALQTIMDGRPELNGAKVKDIFSMDSRIDVYLNATEAKKIGLISKIVKITPSKAAEVSKHLMAALGLPGQEKTAKQNSNPENMTIEALKAQHPEVYNALVNQTLKAERDRVGAYLAFVDVSKKEVLEGIKSGEALSQTAMAEFSIKLTTSNSLAALKTESAEDVATDETKEEKEAKAKKAEVVTAEKAKEDFMASFRKEANLKVA